MRHIFVHCLHHIACIMYPWYDMHHAVRQTVLAESLKGKKIEVKLEDGAWRAPLNALLLPSSKASSQLVLIQKYFLTC